MALADHRTNRQAPEARPPAAHSAARARRCRPAGAPARVRAFTLAELAVAIAITGLLAGIAWPTFGEWLGAYQQANHARHIAETMTRARTEAARRGHRVNLCKSQDGHQCGAASGWNAGFLLFVDSDGDGQVGDGEPVLAIDGPAAPGITVQPNAPLDEYVSYTSLGRAKMLNGALQMGRFAVCRSRQRELHVVLASSGRVRVERSGVSCP